MAGAGFGKLYGRSAEVRTVSALLADPHERLVTVTGLAGAGKSHIAHAAVADLPRGRCAIVDMADVADVRGVWNGLGGETLEDVVGLVREHPAVVLLDNCDRVAEGIAGRLSQLLRVCPQLTVLVTSRILVNLRTERVVPIQPLPTGEGSQAADLLTDLVSPHYRFGLTTDAGRRKTADVCAETEGVPLAIELAAEAVGPGGMDTVLESLRGGTSASSERAIDVPARHRSLEAAMAWGDSALSDRDRRLLRDLSVFEGVFSVPGVQRVSSLDRASAGEGIASLVRKSLVSSAPGCGGEPAFRLPRMVRRYYGRPLAAEPAALIRARDLHAAHIRELASLMASSVPVATTAVEVVAENLPDVRAATAHLRARGDHLAALRLLTDLAVHLLMHNVAPEAADELEDCAIVVHAAGTDDAAVAEAMIVAARHALVRGDVEHAERSLGFVTGVDRIVAARVAALRGEIARLRGETADALRRLRAAAGELAALGEPVQAAAVRGRQALAAASQGAGEPDRLVVEALELLQAGGGSSSVEAGLFTALARVQKTQGRTYEAYCAASQAVHLLSGGGEPQAAVEAVTAMLSVSAAQTGEQMQGVARVLAGVHALREGYGRRSGEETESLRAVEERLRRGWGEGWVPQPVSGAHRPTVAEVLSDALGILAPPVPAAVTGAAHPHGLTARQYEISLLVAEGLTNRQIASQLTISEWTVVNHLRQVMQKLDCPSRVHVARRMQALGVNRGH